MKLSSLSQLADIAFRTSYLLLFAILAIQSVVLRRVLRETVWLRRIWKNARQHHRRDDLPLGTSAPSFVLPLTGTKRFVASSDFKDQATLLAFVNDLDSSGDAVEHLRQALHALWHKADKHLYVVYSGSAESDGIPERLRFECEGLPISLPCLLDANGAVRRAFHIHGLSAVMLDRRGRIERYGYDASFAGLAESDFYALPTREIARNSELLTEDYRNHVTSVSKSA